MKPKNDCKYYVVAGFGYYFKLCTLASLICMFYGVLSNPKKVVVLHRTLLQFAVECILK